MEKYLVSACLLGIDCNYAGKSNLNPKVKKLFDENQCVLICPESMGGLKSPRHPCEIINGKAINSIGEDKTKEFEDGAKRVLEIATKLGIKKAVLKANSPSCGVHHIYDGTFSHVVIDGKGITAKLLADNGIELKDENDL